MGLALFVRDKGRLIARPEARLLVREVEDIAAGVGRLQARIADARAGAAGDGMLRAAFPSSLANTLLPTIVAGFLAAFPRVTIEILTGPYSAVERMVKTRAADFGFVRLPPEDRAFTARMVATSGTTCVMPIDHRLAGKASIAVADLARTDLILLGRQRVNRDELEHLLRRQAPSYRCRVEVHSVETACACAARGLGVAIVPTLIARFFASPRLAMRPFADDPAVDYGIITLADTPLGPAGEEFVARVAAELATDLAAGA
jgi:DNA-binding transcriptional LysR family regulator